jgi:hypothetical protein
MLIIYCISVFVDPQSNQFLGENEGDGADFQFGKSAFLF